MAWNERRFEDGEVERYRKGEGGWEVVGKV
jgi:hypothetical protein